MKEVNRIAGCVTHMAKSRTSMIFRYLRRKRAQRLLSSCWRRKWRLTKPCPKVEITIQLVTCPRNNSSSARSPRMCLLPSQRKSSTGTTLMLSVSRSKALPTPWWNRRLATRDVARINSQTRGRIDGPHARQIKSLPLVKPQKTKPEIQTNMKQKI